MSAPMIQQQEVRIHACRQTLRFGLTSWDLMWAHKQHCPTSTAVMGIGAGTQRCTCYVAGDDERPLATMMH